MSRKLKNFQKKYKFNNFKKINSAEWKKINNKLVGFFWIIIQK